MFLNYINNISRVELNLFTHVAFIYSMKDVNMKASIKNLRISIEIMQYIFIHARSNLSTTNIMCYLSYCIFQ